MKTKTILVIITVIACVLLIGIPALRKSREQAARREILIQIKMLQDAIQEYEKTKGSYPRSIDDIRTNEADRTFDIFELIAKDASNHSSKAVIARSRELFDGFRAQLYLDGHADFVKEDTAQPAAGALRHRNGEAQP